MTKDKDKRAAQQHRYYEHNKSAVLERNRERKRLNLRILAKIKGATPCVDCGGIYPPECMDFHHVGAKRDTVSRLTRSGTEVMLAEVRKCELLCANCHRIRHKSRGVAQRKSVRL